MLPCVAFQTFVAEGIYRGEYAGIEGANLTYPLYD